MTSQSPSTPTTLTSEQRRDVQNEVQRVMDAVVERIHYAEGRRTSFSVIAGALIAGGIALLTFSLGNVDSSIAKFCIGFTAVAMLAVGTFILLIYSRQTNRYPWTSATKTWKWFYRDALPDQSQFNLGWASYFWFGKAGQRVKKAFSAQLRPFIDSLAKLTDSAVSLDQDAQQLYVLHVNEKYKNMHLADLRTATNIGLICIFLSAVAGATYGYTVEASANALKQVHVIHESLDANGRWHILPHVGESKLSDVILSAVVSNSGKTSTPLPHWVPYDQFGLRIPAAIESSTLPTADTIEPKANLKYSIVFQISAAAAKSELVFRPEF
jgi:hypothetical protein